MIDFLNEYVRTEFHLLPISEQKKWKDFADKVATDGYILKILDVAKVSDKCLEVSVRIDKKLN